MKVDGSIWRSIISWWPLQFKVLEIWVLKNNCKCNSLLVQIDNCIDHHFKWIYGYLEKEKKENSQGEKWTQDPSPGCWTDTSTARLKMKLCELIFGIESLCSPLLSRENYSQFTSCIILFITSESCQHWNFRDISK